MYINIPLLGSWSLSSMFGLAALSPAEVNTMIGNYYLFIITDFTIILFFNLLIIWLQMGWIHYIMHVVTLIITLSVFLNVLL